MATIEENLQTIKSSTTAIKNAIINKGGIISGNITTWASAINEISGGGADDVHNFTGEIIDNTIVGITNYKTIVVNEGVTKVQDYAFYHFDSAVSVYIPDSVTYMGTNVFYNCQKLETARLSNNIPQIMSNAFYHCKKLKSIEIPTSVFLLGTQAFRDCVSLVQVICPSSVTTIRGSAFRDCDKLKKVVFEGAITSSIPISTFQDCPVLEIVNFSNCTSVLKLDNISAFSGVPNTCKIVVPDALYDDWIVATNWSTFASQIIKKSDYDAL